MGIAESLFLACGFDGLFMKYGESACRYAMYATLLSLGTTAISFVITLNSVDVISFMVFYYIMSLLSIAISIVSGYAFWKIRNSSANPLLTSVTAITMVGYYPLAIMAGLFSLLVYWLILVISVLSMASGLFLVLTFRAEKGLSPKAIIRRW